MAPSHPPAQGTDVDAHLGQHPPPLPCGEYLTTSTRMARQALQGWWCTKHPFAQHQMKAAKDPAAEAPH